MVLYIFFISYRKRRLLSFQKIVLLLKTIFFKVSCILWNANFVDFEVYSCYRYV